MRKKKCLGCGKIFGDKISVCQDCFNAIENTRSQFDTVPKSFKKQTLIFFRRFYLFMGVFGSMILLGSCLVSLFLIFAALVKLKYNLALLLSLHFMSILFISIFGLWMGMIMGRRSVTEYIKMLANKESYLSKTIRKKMSRKVWLPFGLVVIILILLETNLDNIFVFLKIQSLYEQGSLMVAFGHIILGSSAGFAFNHYFRMSWVQELSK